MEGLTSGERIRQIRKEKGFTQKKLAEKCGMFESAIGRIEKSKGIPRTDTLDKIANALGVSTVALLPTTVIVDTYDGKVYGESSIEDGKLDKIYEKQLERYEKENDNSAILYTDGGGIDKAIQDNTVRIMKKLNFSGQIRVCQYAQDLAKIPEYINNSPEE